jgi:hypothetical protein
VHARSRARTYDAENGWCVDGEAHPELAFPGVRTSPELGTEDMKNMKKMCCACGGGKGLCRDSKSVSLCLHDSHLLYAALAFKLCVCVYVGHEPGAARRE